MAIHAGYLYGLLTFCGLSSKDHPTSLVREHSLPTQSSWHRIVDCLECQASPEFQACIVEVVLASRPVHQ